MATLQPRQALYYTSALATFLYTTVSVAIDFGKIQNAREERNRRSRLHTIIPISLIVLSYTIEAITTAWQDRSSFVHSEAQIVHAIALAVTWSVVGARQRKTRATTTKELWGVALLTTVSEVGLFVLSVPGRGFGSLGPMVLLGGWVVRLLVLVFLIVYMVYGRYARKSTDIDADETEPFLPRYDGDRTPGEITAYGTETTLHDHPAIEEDGDSDSGDDSDDEFMKKQHSKRLRETGSWWSYFKDFRIFLPFLIPRNDRKVQLCFCASIFCLIGTRALHVLIPRQLGIAVDQVLAKESPYKALSIWVVLDLLSSRSGLGLIQELVKIPIKQFSYRQITNAAFSHVMTLSMEFHATRDSAEVMKAVDQSESLTNLLETGVLDIAPTLVDLVVSYAMLYWKFNGYCSLAMVVASVSYLSLEVYTSNWNIENRRRLTKAQRAESQVMHRAIQGSQTVAYFNRFFFEKCRFSQSVDAQLAANKRWSRCDAYIEAILAFLIPTAFFSLCCLVLYDVSHGRASAGDFVFFTQYWETLMWPVIFLSDNYRWLMGDLVDAERLLDLLQTQPTITDKEDARDLDCVRGHVAFKHVDFAYDPRKQTIEDLDFSAEPGQTIALVGMTGAGKSSILKLLLRFYDVSSGRVEIDGQDVRDVTLSSIREAIGVVPQGPILFNASIMENIRYARPSAADEEIFTACQAAAIHEKILTFPETYQTNVGEQGVKLSGGEIQRLAIARIFLKDPAILVLDEATSAVDTNTENEIQDALDRVRRERTTFVIAHRLSTIAAADRILVMHEGRIVESGTHEELLEVQGRYYMLWENQVRK